MVIADIVEFHCKHDNSLPGSEGVVECKAYNCEYNASSSQDGEDRSDIDRYCHCLFPGNTIVWN